MLCQAAWAAIKKKDSRLTVVYSRIAKRAGKPKANMAIAHLMIRIIDVMLRDKVPYEELGREYLISDEQAAEFLVKKLQKLGYRVELTASA